jgi:hypothetical protein
MKIKLLSILCISCRRTSRETRSNPDAGSRTVVASYRSAGLAVISPLGSDMICSRIQPNIRSCAKWSQYCLVFTHPTPLSSRFGEMSDGSAADRGAEGGTPEPAAG